MIFSATILQGRTYLVTGATGGAGGAAARLIAKCGGRVMVDGRDPERVAKVKNSLVGGPHGTWGSMAGDGPIDGIFHAAGSEFIGPTGMFKEDVMQRVMEPSLDLALKLMKGVGSRGSSILKDGGSIVFMSSVAAIRGTPGMTIYSASKGAIESLTLSAAMEFAPRRIRVNTIRAGAFESPMHARLMSRTTQHAADEYAAKHPLGFGRAEDIANAAIFLLSDASKWITGTILTCDGGFSCK